MKKGGHFYFIKTYVLRLNLDGLMDFLLNRRSYLTVKHNCSLLSFHVKDRVSIGSGF